MPFKLIRLAAGSYDLLLDDKIVGSVVRNVSARGELTNWRAELLDDTTRPEPFERAEHSFPTLVDVTIWLGSPDIVEEPDGC